MAKKVRNQQGFSFRHNPPRVVNWGAVSTGKQAQEDKDSIHEQFRTLREHEAKQGWQVVDEVVIPGFSRDFFTYEEFCAAAEKAGIKDPRKMFKHWMDQDVDIIACVNFSRLGREEAIIQEFVGRTYGMGSYIFTSKNGLIPPEQRRHITMIEAYGSKSEVDEMQRRHQFGMRAGVKDGRPVNWKLPHFHKAAYDDRGRLVETPGQDGTLYFLTVNREKQAELDLLFDLFVRQHTTRLNLEPRMAEYGVTDAEGQPYYPGYYFDQMWKPAFHGHLSWSAFAVRSRWLIDPLYEQEKPANATIAYDVCEAAYPPDQLAEVRTELLSRQRFRGGGAKPNALNRFSMLCVCAGCGYYLTSHVRESGHRYYYCHHKRPNSRAGVACPERKSVREDVLQRVFDARVQAALRGELLLPPATTPADDNQIALITHRIADLKAEITNLAQLQAKAHNATALNTAIDQINQRSEQIEQLEARLHAETSRTTQVEIQHARLTDPAYRQRLEHIWELSDTDINYTLREVLQHWRVEVSDGQPVGLKWVEE